MIIEIEYVYLYPYFYLIAKGILNTILYNTTSIKYKLNIQTPCLVLTLSDYDETTTVCNVALSFCSIQINISLKFIFKSL